MWVFPNDGCNTDLNIIAIPLEISVVIRVELYHACTFLNVLSSLLHLGGVEDPRSQPEQTSPKRTRMKLLSYTSLRGRGIGPSILSDVKGYSLTAFQFCPFSSVRVTTEFLL